MTILKSDVEQFFERYAQAFKEGLEGSLDIDALRSLYAPQYIAAGPNGVAAGDNDDRFGEHLLEGYERYRRLKAMSMTVTAVDVHPIDETHCLARIGWNSAFEKDGGRIDIPFTNSYFLELSDAELKVFGWVTGDEWRLLKDHGLM